ncbi:MAG: ribosomal protection-like ABC-F family protein [Saccharofermentanales bacterium]
MSLINIINLTFSYDGSYDKIFENVSFQIDTDWKLGFTGRNGRGKTTFLNLLLGKYEFAGNITASVDFEYFPYPVKDFTKQTIDILNIINNEYQMWELEREMNKLAISFDVLYRSFNTLSNGEQTKILLAILFLKKNNFLLIDEPTNHLDMVSRKIVADYLKSKNGFILVSHDRTLLDSCIDHILSINKTNIEIQRGNFSSWLINKERQDNYELAENLKLKKESKRLEKTAREKAAWSFAAEKRKIGFDPVKTEKSMGRRSFEGAKSKKLMKRAKVIEARKENVLAEKVKLLKNLEKTEVLKISPLNYQKNLLVTLNDVSIFNGLKTICRSVTFDINQGDRIALCGINGSGKTSILRLINGENIDFKGKYEKGKNLLISYVPQETSHLSGTLDEYAACYGIDIVLFKAILNKLDFTKLQYEKNISSYSDGQKKKVLIARSLCEKANLYIWDEPLNYIDVLSRIQIEKLLIEYKPTILFVEHDMKFCENVATKFVRL